MPITITWIVTQSGVIIWRRIVKVQFFRLLERLPLRWSFSEGDTIALWNPLNNSVMFSPNDPAELTRRSRVMFSKYPIPVGEIFQVYVKLRETSFRKGSF